MMNKSDDGEDDDAKLAKIKSDVADEAKAKIAAATEEMKAKRAAKDAGAISAALAEWVYVAEATCFVRLSDGWKLGERQWRPLFADLRKKEDVVAYVQRHGLIQTYERFVFEPDAPQIIGATFNQWVPSTLVAKPGNIDWFMDHIVYLVPEPAEREKLLDFLSLAVKPPYVKIQYAVLLIGEPGIGKSIFGPMFGFILGENNVVEPGRADLHDKWTSWREGKQLIFIHELRIAGRGAALERLDTSITEVKQRIVAHYRATYTLAIRQNHFTCSNHGSPLSIRQNDRRWFILESTAARRPDAYYDALWAHVNSSEDMAAVKYYLENREVVLNPFSVAPVTSAKRAMVEEVKSDIEVYLSDLFEQAYYPFDFDLVQLAKVEEMIQAQFKYERNVRKAATDFMHSICARRYEKPGGPTAFKERINFHVWSIRNHDKWEDMGATDRCRALQAFRKQRDDEELEEIERLGKEAEAREKALEPRAEIAARASQRVFNAVMEELGKHDSPEDEPPDEDKSPDEGQ
jgi:hypothetical protein